ncbi:MAG TPA: hypothetical protein DCL38_05455 [Lachnospiraceae bacterium]|nr:hypothetical protein [Lachnospiraceae bacterium]
MREKDNIFEEKNIEGGSSGINGRGDNNGRRTELFRASHLLLLISLSLMTVLLFIEAVILSWELWVLPLVAIAEILCWHIHVTGRLPEDYRLWIYTVVALFVFVFYGIHESSFYDMAIVIVYLMILYSLSSDQRFILCCQAAYYLTMCYDMVLMIKHGTRFDILAVTRIALHFIIVFMVGYVSRVIMRKRSENYDLIASEVSGVKNVNRSIGNFLKSLSHEIRTPINAVTGLTSVVLKKERDEEIRRDLSTVLRAGFRAADQIDNILDMTEIDMDNLQVRNSVYMISSILNDLITELRLKDRVKRELIFDVDTSTPSALIGDSDKIKKVLKLLIDNGLKYTRHGGVYVHIFPRERSYGINLCVEIADTGVGMTETQIDRIFEPYYKANQAGSRTTGGIGIGVMVAHGLLKAMGGFIRIESEPNAGTTVSVSIPQRIADPSACMFIADRDSVRAGVYLGFSRSEVPRVREFYNTAFSGFKNGLGLNVRRADSLEDLKRLNETFKFTHILTGDTEYREDASFFDDLAHSCTVVVIADDSFSAYPDSPVKVMKKPFYGFPLAAFLNEEPVFSTEALGKKESFNGLKVLVVDDEPMNLLVARGILGGYGMKVTEAASGAESIELCKRRHFDVVFMDYIMPEMDGIEAMKIIRANSAKKDQDIVIISLTANAVSSAREMFLSEGFDGFVTKPIETAELERELKRVLKRPSPTGSLRLRRSLTGE